MAKNIIRNSYGEAVFADYSRDEAQASSLRGASPTQIANSYLERKLGELGLSTSRVETNEAALSDVSRQRDPIIRFSNEKKIGGTTVVVYEQYVLGLPIFDARIGVQIEPSAMTVTSAQSSMHGIVDVQNSGAIEKFSALRKLNVAAARKLLGISLDSFQDARIERQYVYRFESEQRVEKIEDENEGCFGEHGHPTLDLPSLPATISNGQHYVVNEVLFRASRMKDEPPVNWRALVEPDSGAILYIRALVSCATGMLFARDPQTQTGAAVTGASSNAVLNPFRSSLALQGVASATPQPLSGEYVQLAEIGAPAIAAPVAPNPMSAFNFDVRTDDFSAVNAYYHSDNLFRTMADYGFDVFNYFDGTSFPVPVDHRSLGAVVNARAPGNAMGNGLGGLEFALLQAGEPVGIATDNRVVWHEFGHGLLWDHVNSPNFGFAHSAGDSLAAILNDPGSNAVDRFNTFPWVQQGTDLGRRHGRTVADGWAWFGPSYNTQYSGEQILCTTMFRLYRSIGGDSSWQPTQVRASQTVAYLIFAAIGQLVATTNNPEIFVANLENADKNTPNFKGIPGGALHKVVRWAFEKQGLFQPSAQPGQGNTVMAEGNPPTVDVYIDDGRNGEYQYLANHWSCQDMWVRRAADGGPTHQHPVVGLTNYMYVRVKNRGMQAATNVRVNAYHCLPGTGLAFPDDWAPMATAMLPAGGPVAPGGQTIVGPFAFVPTQVGHECLLAIAHADGDPGKDTTITGTIPEHRFVPFDNNIGQRNVSPVLPSLKHLVELLGKHVLWVRNPLKKPVVAYVEIELPRFLAKLDWKIDVVSEGGPKFEIGPRDRREVVLRLEPGKEFTTDQAKRAIAEGDHQIKLLTFLDGELSGGMAYTLSFENAEDDRKPPKGEKPKADIPRPFTIEEILRILRGQPVGSGPISDRRIKTVRLELDLSDD
jgi:zinc metalloprotease ZmpB